VRILRVSYSGLVNEKQPDQSPFRPGMSATVDIRTRKVNNVITVPIQAVTTRSEDDLKKKDDDKSSRRKRRSESSDEEAEIADDSEPTILEDAVEVVFVLKEGEVAARKVETGIQDNEFIEVKTGVASGESVVTSSYRSIPKKLSTGDAVEVVTQDELYGGEAGDDK